MFQMKALARGIALAGLLGAALGARPAAAQTTVVDGINHVGFAASTLDDAWNSPEVGWFYTPGSSYTLKGIESKFAANVPGKVVTLEVRSATGNTVGGLLRSGTFSPTSQAFTGATFTDLPLTSGTTYFIGFRNVDGVGLNVTDGGGTGLTAFRSGATNSGLYEQLETAPANSGDLQFAPILRFMGPDEVVADAVPEPASFALFLPALAAVGFAAKRRSRT